MEKGDKPPPDSFLDMTASLNARSLLDIPGSGQQARLPRSAHGLA